MLFVGAVLSGNVTVKFTKYQTFGDEKCLKFASKISKNRSTVTNLTTVATEDFRKMPTKPSSSWEVILDIFILTLNRPF